LESLINHLNALSWAATHRNPSGGLEKHQMDKAKREIYERKGLFTSYGNEEKGFAFLTLDKRGNVVKTDIVTSDVDSFGKLNKKFYKQVVEKIKNQEEFGDFADEVVPGGIADEALRIDQEVTSKIIEENQDILKKITRTARKTGEFDDAQLRRLVMIFQKIRQEVNKAVKEKLGIDYHRSYATLSRLDLNDEVREFLHEIAINGPKKLLKGKNGIGVLKNIRVEGKQILADMEVFSDRHGVRNSLKAAVEITLGKNKATIKMRVKGKKPLEFKMFGYSQKMLEGIKTKAKEEKGLLQRIIQFFKKKPLKKFKKKKVLPETVKQQTLEGLLSGLKDVVPEEIHAEIELNIKEEKLTALTNIIDMLSKEFKVAKGEEKKRIVNALSKILLLAKAIQEGDSGRYIVEVLEANEMVRILYRLNELDQGKKTLILDSLEKLDKEFKKLHVKVKIDEIKPFLQPEKDLVNELVKTRVCSY